MKKNLRIYGLKKELIGEYKGGKIVPGVLKFSEEWLNDQILKRRQKRQKESMN